MEEIITQIESAIINIKVDIQDTQVARKNAYVDDKDFYNEQLFRERGILQGHK